MRRAVVVGIDDFGREDARLNGCVADALAWRDYFAGQGFVVEQFTDGAATREDVTGALERAARDTKDGDVLGFAISSHGSQVPDTSGDEPDRLDEVIVMADALTGSAGFVAGCLTDDRLHGIVRSVPRGAHVFGILDCCHAADRMRGFLSDSMQAKPPRARFLQMPGLEPAARGGRKRIQLTEADVVLAACQADETAADAWISEAVGYRGAFSYHLREALRLRPAHQVLQVLNECQTMMRRARFRQTPHLGGRRVTGPLHPVVA